MGRILIGGALVFSGFVKAIDSLGVSYKISDYFIVWNFRSFRFIALLFSFILSAFEFVSGFCLLVGIYQKVGRFCTMVFMTIFSFYISFVFIISLSLYSYMNLPSMDFSPYKIGNDIKKEMTIPKGAPKYFYETTFFYEKRGEKKEFTLKDYPKNDLSWKFISSKSI